MTTVNQNTRQYAASLRREERKRREMIAEFYSRLFLLGGMITGTDTYKRTMAHAFRDFALNNAVYHLTLRKGMTEPGAGDQLVMAGHELLNQWFHRPVKRADILVARDFSLNRSAVKVFPTEMWDRLLASHGRKQNIHLPVDVWGFPGGQTFLKNVPCLVFDGVGGIVSYLEPAMCRYFAPVIQATKGRLMRNAAGNFAEFGLRAAQLEDNHLLMLLALFVGAGGVPILTSNDTAEFMWPDMFKAIGTIGHEGMSSNQSLDRSLGECELEMMNLALANVPNSKLLCDLVDAETIGLDNYIRALLANPDAVAAGARVDSGDIAAQCATYHLESEAALSEAGIVGNRVIVYEDEVNPVKCMEVAATFYQRTGRKPDGILFPGAGGYFQRDVHRDTVSAAFKRSQSDGNPNMKFSNSPGKESIPGNPRVYGRGDVMYIADASENVDGVPLFVKLVDQGRIVYDESHREQGARANETWGKYTRVERSPLIQFYIETYTAKRDAERKAHPRYRNA